MEKYKICKDDMKYWAVRMGDGNFKQAGHGWPE